VSTDPLRHPDLARLGRTLRDRLDEVLTAEQEAALAARNRRRTLRDRLLEAEDRREDTLVGTVDGHLHQGSVTAVGVDHVVLDADGKERYVALDAIVSAEFR
jgi:hypothetical protein